MKRWLNLEQHPTKSICLADWTAKLILLKTMLSISGVKMEEKTKNFQKIFEVRKYLILMDKMTFS